jgi:hypothetical protein
VKLRRKATETRPAAKRCSRAIFPSAQAPPRPLPLPRLLEVCDGQRPALGNLPVHGLDIAGPALVQLCDPLTLAPRQALHAVPMQREVLDRRERSHPRPILEDPPLLQGTLQQTGVVGAEPGEQGEVMGPFHDIHRVDLQHVQRPDRPDDMAQIRSGLGAGRGQALGADGSATCLGSAEPSHQGFGGRMVSDIGRWWATHLRVPVHTVSIRRTP